MAEYIEREAAKLRIFEYGVRHRDNSSISFACENLERQMNSIPAADVRPVVTCADCKYNTREVNDLFGNKAIQCITGLTHRRDWFCADGKKREES